MAHYDYSEDCAEVFEPEEGYERHNREMNQAWQFVANTDVSVFLTGKAGTGKTTFLKKLRELMPKRMVVLAPTGVAAINAQGQTINSFFQLPFGPYIPGKTSDPKQQFKMSQNKKNMIRTLDLLVIDEVSMVRADMLDQVDDTLRRYRDRTRPFGGVQLLLIGDLMQLSPVAKAEEWNLLQPYYDTPYFFSSHALRQLNYVTIELRHIYRQQDQTFIDLLAQVRNGQVTDSVIERLNSRYIPNFRPVGDDWIRLTTHNIPAQRHNEIMLETLPSEVHTFEAQIKDDFPEYNFPADRLLVLKEGAQVMFVKNDPSGAHRYYNGRIGTVTAFGEDYIEVTCDHGKDVVKVQPVVWENTKYALNPRTKEIEEQTVGTFTQYPLRLAWAITVHKSQGLTFDHAVLDINASFTHGQVYVALSRCRSLEGLVLSSPLYSQSVMTDPTVNGFIDQSLSHIDESLARLPQYMRNYTLSLLDQLYDLEQITLDYQWLTRVVDEYLSRQHPVLLALLKESPDPVARLKQIATRFRLQYMDQVGSTGRIAGTPLEARIKESCSYFDNALTETFAPLLKKCVINIENQQIAEVYNNALRALRATLTLKSTIFRALAQQTFNTHNYLSSRSKALLDVSDAPTGGKKGVSGAYKRAGGAKADNMPPKPKRQKGDTLKETLRLYNEGLDVQQIAEKRSLALSTIYSHMSALIQQGYVELNDIVSPERQIAVTRVADTFDEGFNVSDVVEKLPEGYTSGEVRLILQNLRG